MPMPDFTQHTGECDGSLVKFAVKADGTVEDAYVYEAQVAFTIADMTDARIAEGVAPGASEVFTRSSGDDNWKHSSTVSPGTSLGPMRVTLSHADRGKVAIEGMAEVKALALRASKKAVVLSVKLAFGGQSAGIAANLAALLRSACCMSFERPQGVLPFRAKDATEANIGDVVVAWDGKVHEHFVGRLAEVEGDRLTLESFGNEFAASKAGIVAVLKLDGDVPAMVRSYEMRCGRRDVTPTWEAIVMAAAETGDGLLNGGGLLTLTPEILERAVARLESGDADLPAPVAEVEQAGIAY